MSVQRSNDGDQRSKERCSIATFFAGRSVFITGSTGFLGKVLIEKLLRSCPEIREIYLLMRPKKGVCIEDRLKEIIRLPLYDKLREERPSNFSKLIPIRGDTSVEGLGLASHDRETIIDRVSVIFHVAANVRFEENLQKDIFSNTRSTRDVCVLASSMQNLVALMHVSSAYAQCDKPMVDETLYSPITDWKSTIKMVETLDEQTIRTFTPKYLNTMPNTYTFSKRLAEQVIADYSKELPCVVFRPSIVISTINDPASGWLDNFNGPVGIMVGGAKGILRVIRVDPEVCSDFLPVDVAIKAMLIATWKRGLVTVSQDPEVHVYNCSSYNIRRVVSREIVTLGLKSNAERPLDGIIWYPRTVLTKSRFLHYVLTLLVHLLPSLIIDRVLKMTGRRPMLVNLHKKIYTAVVMLSPFLNNEWVFHNYKMLDLFDTQVPSIEQDIFGFDYRNFDVPKYFENCLIGTKRYLLHDDLSRTEENKRRLERLHWLDRIVNAFLIGLLVWILWKVGFFARILDMFWP
ncbi:putative fatty acyl-CoA reductase CG5065 [Lasioglossum baleicum]|uniref:putative fatty acyl-CoA reductase CG5065 n=1 Tax=Lasioglossum baleicum TaxID=434251 RepID=UPI003FCC32FE